MVSGISCQFVVPLEIVSLCIIVGDRRDPGGNAFFGNIWIANREGNTCDGVTHSGKVIYNLVKVMIGGRLDDKTKSMYVHRC